MAYWVGGSGGNWADPTKWSSSSGGTAANTLGSDLLSGWDFTSGWTTGVATINDSNTFTLNSVGGGIYKSGLTTTGKGYKCVIAGSVSVGGLVIQDWDGGSYVQSLLTGTFSSTIYFMGKGTKFAFVPNTNGAVIDITSLTLEEVTCFPSSTIDAIFDANSFSSDSQTVTINAANCACKNLDFSAIDQTVTFANSTYTDFKVYGNLVLPATKLTWTFTGTGYVTLAGTGSQTITTNGMTSNMNRLYFDGSGGTWTNQDAANFGNTYFYLKNGTWNTNNFNVTTTGRFITEVGTKTLTLGSSVFIVSYWNNAEGTNFTFNYNTSTVKVIGASTLIVGAASTFYKLTLEGTYADTYFIQSNVTINDLLTLTGANATNYRLLVTSNVIGTQRTITAASISASNCDFRDIKLAGACSKDLSAIIGGSGDCGGNTDITFSTPETKYYKHTSGACTWKDTTKWVTASGGSTTSTARFLPQDSHILDANSFTGTSTLTIDVPRKGSVDMSGVSQSVTTTLANATEHYGHLILGSNITPSGNYTRTLMGRGSYNLNLYSKTIFRLYTNNYGGTYTFLSGFTVGQIIQMSGTINLGNNTIIFTENNGSFYAYSGGTINCQTSTLISNPSNSLSVVTFSGGGKTFYKVWFSGSHTGYFDITGSNTFNELKIDPGRKVRVTAGTTQTVSKLNAVGAQANPITIQSVTNAVHDLALASGQPNPQCDWLILHNSRCNVSFYAGNGSANVPSMGNGLLYNWYAVNDAHGLAPAGCHIPTSTEWATLSTYLGGDSVSGGKLKSINSIFWNTPNTGADNSSGFFAFGSGIRFNDGSFGYQYQQTYIYGKNLSQCAILSKDTNGFVYSNINSKYGNSVRCICDTPYYLGQVITDVDGNRYGTVLIGTQTWLTSNLKTTKYADGTSIPNVTDNSAWAALTTGAYCSYNNAAIVEYPANNTNWVLANQSKGMLSFF